MTLSPDLPPIWTLAREWPALGLPLPGTFPQRWVEYIPKLRKAHGRDLHPRSAAQVGRIVEKLDRWWSECSDRDRELISGSLEPEALLSAREVPAIPERWDPRAELPPERWIKGFDRRGWSLHLYQARALEFLRSRPRALLAMEMGLGKTLIGALWLARLFAERAISRAVIVAPLSAHATWADHLQLTALRPRIMSGWTRERRARGWDDLRTGAADLVVISPQGVSRTARRVFDSDQALGALSGGALLIDEAHKIKGESSAIGRTIEVLSQRAGFCVGMSGTPKPNRIGDFYLTLSRICGPGLGTLEEFVQRYTYPKEDLWGGAEYLPGPVRGDRLRELWERCSEVVFIRTGADIDAQIPLPPRHDETPDVELDDDQRAIAQGVARACALAIDAPQEIERLARSERPIDRVIAEGASAGANAPGLRLEQLAVCPSVFSETFRRSRPDYISPKIGLICDRLKAHFEAQPGSAALLFCEWIRGLEAVKRALIARGVVDADRVAIYSGQVSQTDRRELVRALNEGDLDVLIAQHKSLETGANLQARCSFVGHVSSPWAPDTLVQTTGRVYRQGQRRPVYVVRPSGSSIERAKNQALSAKIRETGQLLGVGMEADRAVLRSTSRAEGQKWAKIYAQRLKAYAEKGEL